jgi:hypothetical protein
MISADSKLFYGVELGKLPDVIKAYSNFINQPPRKPNDLVDFIGYINTQLPDGVFLEVTYPIRNCPESEMIAHLTLLDGDENISSYQMIDILTTSNYCEYYKFLTDIGFEWVEPKFYTRHYIYKVKCHQ